MQCSYRIEFSFAARILAQSPPQVNPEKYLAWQRSRGWRWFTKASRSVTVAGVETVEIKREPIRHIDPWWRKARIAARLLLKKEEHKPWSARDRVLAARLVADPGVTNRLIDQAVSFLTARKNGHRLLDR